MTRAKCVVLILSLLLLEGCARYQNTRGVEVGWEASIVDQLLRGKTTRQELMEQLGPPSQVIAVGDETVLYYLFEHSDGEGFILILYNRFTVETRYDRAIFFFDDRDLLTDYATHTAQVDGD